MLCSSSSSDDNRHQQRLAWFIENGEVQHLFDQRRPEVFGHQTDCDPNPIHRIQDQQQKRDADDEQQQQEISGHSEPTRHHTATRVLAAI